MATKIRIHLIFDGRVVGPHRLNAETGWSGLDSFKVAMFPGKENTMAKSDVSLREEWNTEELMRDFWVIAFSAPFVEVERKSDNVRGLLRFEHSPRIYFDFSPTGKDS